MFFAKGLLSLCMATAAITACEKDEPTGPPSLYVGETTTFSFAPVGETKTIELQTNVEVQLDKTATASWCEVSLSGKTLTVTAGPNTSLAERSTTARVYVTGKDETLTFTQGGQPSAKITVSSAIASSEQASEPISRTYDGVVGDIYHSDWGTKDPLYELIYELEPNPVLDFGMIAYYPRSNKGNGTFGLVSVEVAVNGSEAFEQVLTDFNCNGDGNMPGAGPDGGSVTQEQRDEYPDVVYIELNAPIAGVTSVKIIVDGSTSRAGFASCAEMEFYGIGSATATEPYLLLNKSSYVFAPAGGSVEVGVVTNATSFTVSGEEWCAVTTKGNFVTLTAPENNSGRNREATITVTSGNGLTAQFSVTQQRTVGEGTEISVDLAKSSAESWYHDDGGGNGPFEKMFDNDYATYWHANYDGAQEEGTGPTATPYSLTVYFTGPASLSYINYYTRGYPSGSNGNFALIDIYVKYAGGDFGAEPILRYDCLGKAGATQIAMPEVLSNVEAVKITLLNQATGNGSELNFFSE
jgi:hypothetical protein